MMGWPIVSVAAEAKFHDGMPLTAHDVAWSMTTLKEKGHPIITQHCANRGCEAIDDRPSWFVLPRSAGATCRCLSPALPIFSRAYYSKQAFDQSTLDVPLGSGPYKVGRFEVGHFIEFERVKNWWGADSPCRAGQQISTPSATNIIATARSPSRLYCRELSVPRGVHLAHLGDALRFSRVQGRPRQARRLPDATPSGAQGWFINTGAINSRIGACVRR